MANLRHQDVETRLLELVYDTPPAGLVFPLRNLARDILAEGHPREELLANFERVREELRRRSRAEARELDLPWEEHALGEKLQRMSRDERHEYWRSDEMQEYLREFRARENLRKRLAEAREDAVTDVMDFLYGWSASHMTL
jgi:predicted Holliday junction resolvase-like endonuclease